MLSSSMEQLSNYAYFATGKSPDDTAGSDATKIGEKPSLILNLLVNQQLTEKDFGTVTDKQKDSPVSGLVQAVINDAEQFIEFGPVIKALSDTLLSKLATTADVKPVPPPMNADTQTSVSAMNEIYKKWDKVTPFSIDQGDSHYVGGPHGELFVHNNSTHVDTLKTSSSDDATVITKSIDGVVQGYTSKFTFTTQIQSDGRKLLTITTNSVPAASISLVESKDGKGFDVVDPLKATNDPHYLLRSLTTQGDVQKFDFLIQQFVAAGGKYSREELLADLGLTFEQLQQKYAQPNQSQPSIDATASAIEPLTLKLGQGTQPPVAEIHGNDNIPIYYNFDTGETSVYGFGAAADFVFHGGYDVKTTGFAMALDRLRTSLSGNQSSEAEAQVINTVINAAMAIAQQFMNSSALDAGSAIGQLAALYGELGAMNTVAACYAQAYVSDAMNQVNSGLNKLIQHPDKDRSDVLRDVA